MYQIGVVGNGGYMHMAMHIGVGTNDFVSYLELVASLDKNDLNKNMQMVYCSRTVSSKHPSVQISLSCPLMLCVP